jgi:hypothetical protein
MHSIVKVNMKRLLTGTLVPVKAAFKLSVRPDMNPYLITNTKRCFFGKLHIQKYQTVDSLEST